jgi:NADPH-dependent ferric siderophore reductase
MIAARPDAVIAPVVVLAVKVPPTAVSVVGDQAAMPPLAEVITAPADNVPPEVFLQRIRWPNTYTFSS